jgi:hypothetical protein
MKKFETKGLGRATASLVIGLTLVAGFAGVAGASSVPSKHAAISSSAKAKHAVSHKVAGLVTAASAASLTVQLANGSSETLAIDANTRFFEGKTAVKVAALTKGERVKVTPSAIAAATAGRIDIVLITLEGDVTAVSGSVITITGGAGFTRSIDVSATTTYSERGKSANLLDVVVGLRVTARGTVSADQTSLVANSVSIGAPRNLTGVVTTVSAKSLTVQQSSTVSVTLAILSTTKFFEGNKRVSASDLVTGESVSVRLSTGAPMTAARIDIIIIKLGGIVTAVNDNAITITVARGFARTIDVSGTTTYTEAGKPATLSDVMVGFRINATGFVSADQTALDATSVAIPAPSHIVGTVTAASPASLTVQQANGASATLAIDTNTTFFEGKHGVTAAALSTGEHVNVTPSTLAAATAGRIDIVLIKLVGTVSAVSGNVITITAGAGFTGTVDVSLTTTTYSQDGKAATLSNVLAGMKIVATGTVSADGSALDAISVVIGTPTTFTGIVTALSSSSLGVTSLTVQQSSTVSATLAIISSTTFFEGAKHVGAAALAVGESVNVKLSTGAPSTAARIDIVVVKLGGVVTSVSGGVITVTGGAGFTRSIDVSATTTYTKAGKPAMLSDVQVGFHVYATGTVSASQTALDANSVVINAK